jgi:NADPH-dependent ferric siderophore reductase
MATTTTAPPLRSAYRLFPVHVDRVAALTPHMVRVTFAGASLSGLVGGGRDQRIKVLLPPAGRSEPEVPEDAETLGWYEAWRRMPAEVRPVMRTYTIRAWRARPAEVDVDFALHGTAGPASRWAREAAPGARVLLCGPATARAGGIDFHLPPGTDRVLLAGDETALPAIAAILESLPPLPDVRVLAEVAGPADELPLPGRAVVRWLHRGTGPSCLAEAVRREAPPLDGLYVWTAGEAGAVRELRRHLVGERGMDRAAVSFRGYWRAGLTEDDDDTATERG